MLCMVAVQTMMQSGAWCSAMHGAVWGRLQCGAWCSVEHDGSTVHSGVWAMVAVQGMVAVRGMVQCGAWWQCMHACIPSMGEAETGGSQGLSDLAA